MNLLLRGNLVALQETHWHESAAARWENSFPGNKVVTASAIRSNEGGWLGGVAMIVPIGATVVDHAILEPAYGLQCVVQRGTLPPERFINMYLPPHARLPTLRAIIAGITTFAGRSYFCGDFDIDLDIPRDAEESAIAVEIQTLFSQHNSLLLDGTEKTHNSPTSSTRLDGIAVPAEDCWSWETVARRYNSLSDHSMLTAREAPVCRPAGLACTPASMKRMPPRAIDDLRRRCVALERYHGIPRSDLSIQATTQHVTHSRDQWVLAPDDPAHAIVGHALSSPDSTDPAFNETARGEKMSTSESGRRPSSGAKASTTQAPWPREKAPDSAARTRSSP
eukprot:5570105-Heterocapsa_arctica.AAC.1